MSPRPSLPPRYFTRDLANWGERAGDERGRQKRREKLIPFRSIASRYDYRWCALWERDASNVMHPPIASIFFHHGEKLEESYRSRLSRRIFYYNSSISNRLEDDFFLSRESVWKRMRGKTGKVCSLRVESSRGDACRCISRRQAKRAANRQLMVAAHL